jgi:diguanylate cyclase (GGDEF)-like protein
METTLARADSSLTSLITAARLATNMRDYAGQLGSVFTAPLVGKRPMTAADTTKLDRIMGHLDALNEQFRLIYSKLDPDPAMDTALADVDTRFFGAGRTLVLQTAEIGRTSGSYGMSTAAFAARYVPEMVSVVTLRDAAVARFVQRIYSVRAHTVWSLAFNGVAVALALCVVGATYRVMQVRVSVPLIALTRVIDRLARHDYEIEIPAMKQSDEIGRMAIAIEALRRGAIAAQANEAQIVHLARHDALTDLPNRTLLQERMGQAFGMAGRGEKFAALCLDLDRFKAVNDTFGHPVGDSLLKAVSERLLACVREIDTVSRLGGDEFVILLVGLDTPDCAGETAQRIMQALAEPFDLNGQRMFVGASVGIAIAPDDATSPVGLLRSADTALYRAKLDDRGSYRYFEPEMDQRLQWRVALERDLREGIRDEAFELVYQPQFDLARDKLCGYEALLRWRHPVRGFVGPAEFIPLAEETGLIIAIGAWVLRQACAEAIKWPDAVKVAVNLSAVQFRNNALLATVRQALTDSGLPATRLDLEITESVLLNSSSGTLAMLHELKGLGLSITMDDFGTGYSSLSYLRSFPFDAIKIDQSFVRDLSQHEDSRAIIRAVVALAKALGMRTLAEGVETREQLEELQRAGCDEVQGFLYGKPTSAAPTIWLRQA